jgi:hypothetical protein
MASDVGAEAPDNRGRPRDDAPCSLRSRLRSDPGTLSVGDALSGTNYPASGSDQPSGQAPRLRARADLTAPQVAGALRLFCVNASGVLKPPDGPHRCHSRCLRADLRQHSDRQHCLRAGPRPKGRAPDWLEDGMADRLAAMRRPGESYSDVILRSAERGDAGYHGRAG